MKKNELKVLLKPLIKECINEVLLEEGILSNVVSEVVSGLQSNVVVESPVKQTTAPVMSEQQKNKINEQRQKLMSAIGADAYNGVDLFEDTEPLSSREASGTSAGSVDLGNSSDSGVDISSLVGNASQIWQAMK